MLKAIILDDEVGGSTLLSPDVFFLDVEMPGLNGFQFCSAHGYLKSEDLGQY